MGTPPGWGLEHRASNPISVKNLTAIQTSTVVKLLRPYFPVGTKRTSSSSSSSGVQSRSDMLYITWLFQYGMIYITEHTNN